MSSPRVDLTGQNFTEHVVTAVCMQGVMVDLARAVDLDEWEDVSEDFAEDSEGVVPGPPWYRTAAWWGRATAQDLLAKENQNLDRLCIEALC